ncbi:MAG: hypothetical protein AAF702_48705 [Chloroflexota bacterium]
MIKPVRVPSSTTNHTVLIGLMAPAVLATLTLGIFAVVLPHIREEFNVPADMAL